MSNLPAVKQPEMAVVPVTPQEQIAQASDMARLLKEVVNKAGLAKKLGGRKEHLEFEAWQTIARYRTYSGRRRNNTRPTTMATPTTSTAISSQGPTFGHITDPE